MWTKEQWVTKKRELEDTRQKYLDGVNQQMGAFAGQIALAEEQIRSFDAAGSAPETKKRGRPKKGTSLSAAPSPTASASSVDA